MTAAELKLKYPAYASLGKEVEQKDRVDGRVYIVTTNGSDKECGFITDTYSGNSNHNISGTSWAHWYEIPSEMLPPAEISTEQKRELLEGFLDYCRIISPAPTIPDIIPMFLQSIEPEPELQPTPTIYPKYHQIERMRFWADLIKNGETLEQADSYLKQFDKRFPVNQINIEPLDKDVD